MTEDYGRDLPGWVEYAKRLEAHNKGLREALERIADEDDALLGIGSEAEFARQALSDYKEDEGTVFRGGRAHGYSQMKPLYEAAAESDPTRCTCQPIAAQGRAAVEIDPECPVHGDCPTCGSDDLVENGPKWDAHHGLPHDPACPKCCPDSWHAGHIQQEDRG